MKILCGRAGLCIKKKEPRTRDCETCALPRGLECLGKDSPYSVCTNLGRPAARGKPAAAWSSSMGQCLAPMEGPKCPPEKRGHTRWPCGWRGSMTVAVRRGCLGLSANSRRPALVPGGGDIAPWTCLPYVLLCTLAGSTYFRSPNAAPSRAESMDRWPCGLALRCGRRH